MEQNHPIYVIQRVGKRTNLSQRALNEQNTINIRIKDLGAKLETVTNELNFIANKRLNFHELRILADAVSAKSCIKMDRLTKRHKNALLCWFCENWDSLKSYVISEYNIEKKENLTIAKPPEIVTPVTSLVVPTKQNSPISNKLCFIRPLFLI